MATDYCAACTVDFNLHPIDGCPLCHFKRQLEEAEKRAEKWAHDTGVAQGRLSKAEAERADLKRRLASMQLRLNDAEAEADFSTDRLGKAEAKRDRFRKALERLRGCDWVITLPDRMDAVRKIAHDALEADNGK